MKLKQAWIGMLGILCLAHTSTVWAAPTGGRSDAESGDSDEQTIAFGGGLFIPSPVAGAGKYAFKSGFGGQGELWLLNFLGQPSLSLHGSAAVQSFNIKNLDSYSLLQVTFLAGIEVMSPDTSFLIRPFLGADIGAAHNSLQSPGSDTTVNATGAFVTQVRPGVSFQIARPFSIDLSLPFTSYWSEGRLHLYSIVAGVRIRL